MNIRILAALTAVPLIPALGQLVTAPYSATQITQRTRTLADGTHINQPEQKTLIYRDSQGRTRTEIRPTLPIGLPTGTPVPSFPTIVTILDPVAGYHYMLDSNTKIARRSQVPKMSARSSTGGAAATTAGGIGGGISIASGALYATPQLPPPTSGGNRPRTTSESLGTQVIEGLLADGRRSITTYPAGSVGNDREIVVVRETWISQELKGAMLLSTTSDPRNGDSITKLTDISRAEPDPLLFAVPPDYSIQDQPTAAPMPPK